MVLIIVGCLAVSALTLLFPSTPTYDPWAWILWGREIAHLDLVTEGGPSWKPFPIFFTVPFSFFGQDLAPYLWLWVARAGGLLGCVMAYRMAYRLIGGRRSTARSPACPRSPRCCPATSSCATPRSATPSRCSPRSSCGRSSATSTAAATTRSTSASPPRCCAPRRGRSSGCTGSGCGSTSRSLRKRLVVFAVLVPACWFLPEWWGAGDPLRAGLARERARTRAAPRSPRIPALRSCSSASRESTVAPGGARARSIAVGYAAVAWVPRPRRRATMLALAALGFSWFALVAVMTEAGFAGNQRYLMVTTAAVSRARRRGRGARAPGRRAGSRTRRLGSPRAGTRAGRRPRCVAGVAIASPDDRRQGRQHGPRAGRHRARGVPVARPQGADRRERRQGARCSPAAGSSAAPSRRRWWPTSSASTASTWAGRSRRRRAWRSAPARCRTGRS